MTFSSLFLALLVGQAAAASLVRQEAISVEANGDMKRFVEADATAEDILAKVEDMAQKGAAPDKIKTIKELAGELEVALHDTRNAAEQQVDANLARIKKCNDDQEAAYTKIMETTKKAVDKAFLEHEICRKSEKEKQEETAKKCDQLKDFLKQTPLAGPVMSSDDDADMVDYIGEMDSYWCPMKKRAKEKNDKCTQEKETHREQRTFCNRLQAQCELNFCSMRTQLMDVCEAHTTCYDDALAAYNQHKKVTQQLVQKWKTEYVALKKISCYVNIWLNEDNVKEDHVQKLSVCKKMSPNDAVMEVDFKTPDDKVTCSLEDVKYYPGTPEFKSMKFGQWKFVAEVTTCDSTDESETPSGPTGRRPETPNGPTSRRRETPSGPTSRRRETPSGPTGRRRDSKANLPDCPLVNKNGKKMPVPPAKPFQCPGKFGSRRRSRVPASCPCETACDCATTKICMEMHMKAASSKAREACDAVEMKTATEDEHQCCKDLLHPCLMYQNGCFKKITEGYLSTWKKYQLLNSTMLVPSGALAEAESGSAWSSLMSLRSTRSKAEEARDDGDELDQATYGKCD